MARTLMLEFSSTPNNTLQPTAEARLRLYVRVRATYRLGTETTHVQSSYVETNETPDS
jgi:hypothetical protein